MTRVTVSIVSHGHGELLGALLTDIARLTPASLEQVVVTLNIAEAWTPPSRLGGIAVTVIRNPRPAGFGTNHNRAFHHHCKTPVFAVLNPDLRLPVDPFPELLRLLESGHCALAVPFQCDGQGAIEDFRRRLPTPLALLQRLLRSWRRGDKTLTPTSELDWVAGAFMVMRSKVFESIGGFDERYRLYCEDVDLCLRLQLAGWGIAVAEHTGVVHDARRTSAVAWRYRRWHLLSLGRLWTSSVYWRYRARRWHRRVT